MEYADLDRRIDDLGNRVAGPPGDWNGIWALIREIGSSFKAARYPTPRQREEAWSRFQLLVERVKEAQREWTVQAEGQAKHLEKRLRTLKNSADQALSGFPGASWGDIWSEVKAVRAVFRDTNFPSRERREELWTQLDKITEKLSTHQNERVERSKRCREEIVTLATPTEVPAIAKALAYIVAPHAMLAVDALERLLHKVPERAVLEERQDKLKRAWTLLSEYKSEMTAADKSEVFSELTRLKDDLDNDWARWKEKRHGEHAERRQAFLERVEGRINKLEQDHERLAGVLEHKRGHLEELEEKRDDARSDEFRERVAAWIEEEEAAIRSIQEKLNRIEESLGEERQKRIDNN